MPVLHPSKQIWSLTSQSKLGNSSLELPLWQTATSLSRTSSTLNCKSTHWQTVDVREVDEYWLTFSTIKQDQTQMLECLNPRVQDAALNVTSEEGSCSPRLNLCVKMKTGSWAGWEKWVCLMGNLQSSHQCLDPKLSLGENELKESSRFSVGRRWKLHVSLSKHESRNSIMCQYSTR